MSDTSAIITVTLAPNDAETFLTVQPTLGGRMTRVRVTSRPVTAAEDGNAHEARAEYDVFDVDTWTEHGWTRVLTGLDGDTADDVEQAAHAAWYVLTN